MVATKMDRDLIFLSFQWQIVPGFQNEVSVKLLVTHIQQQLDSRAMRFRNELGQRGIAQHTRRQSVEPINLGKEITSATGSKVRVPENTVVLEQTNQLRVSVFTCVLSSQLLTMEHIRTALPGHPHDFAKQRNRSLQFHLLRRQTVLFGRRTESAATAIQGEDGDDACRVGGDGPRDGGKGMIFTYKNQCRY